MKKLLFLLVLVLTISACTNSPSVPVSTTVDENGSISYTINPSSIRYYGNNVFCFKRDDFGSILSTFIALHPELELVTTCEYDRTMGTLGYYVIFRGELKNNADFTYAIDSTYTLDLSAIRMYENNLYYFHENCYFDEEHFGQAIANFIALHPELELISITGANSHQFGTVGFFANFRNKTVESEK